MSKIRLVLLLIAIVSSCLTSSILHTSNNVKRVKKATTNGDSTYVIDKLSRTARVITAISMLNGLSDGSIETDNVISELLNLGSTDLKSLEHFGKTKVDAFVDKLASFPDNLNDKAKVLEKGLSDYQKTVELWSSVGDYKTLPDDTTYKKLDGIKSLDLTNLKSLPIARSLDLLEKFSTLDGAQVQSLQKSLVDMIAKLKGTEKSIDFEETLDILSRLTPFEPISQSFTLLVPFMVTPFDPKKKQVEIDQMEANFKNVKSLILTDAAASIDSMSVVITSRFLSASTTRTHTAGFINGFTDLKKISADLKDDWFFKNVHPATKIDGIGKLMQLEAPMKTVDDQWKTIATEDVYISVKQIVSVHDRLAALRTDVTKANIEAVMKSRETCSVIPVDPLILTKLASVAKSSSELKRRLSALHLIHSNIDKDKMESTVNSLTPKTSSEGIQKIKEFLKTLGYQLQLVDPETSINVDGLNMADLSGITDFATNVDTADFIKILDCYKNNWKDDFKKVFEALLASMEVRELKKDQKVKANVIKVTSKLSDTADSLKSIRTAVDKLKDDKNEEVKSLVVLKDLQKHSTQFGEAVNALVLAKKVSEKSKDFQLFLDYSASLEKMSLQFVNGKDAMMFWGDVGQTNGDIVRMITGVTDWLNKLKVSKGAKLVDFSSLFNGLSQLNDLNLNTDDRLVALQLLSQNAAQNHQLIKDSKTKLLELSKLDLKFSRFDSSMQSMQQTLSDVSDLLAKDYSPPPKPIPPVPKPNAKPQKLVTSTKEPRESSTEAGLTAGEWIMANWWVIIVGVVVVLFFVWLTAFWILRSKSQDSEQWNKWYRILTLNRGKKYIPPKTPISRVIIPKKPRQGSETTPSTGHPPQPPPDGAAIKKSVEVQPHIDQNERDRDENDRDEDRVRRRNAQQIANENNMDNIEEVATAREPTVRRERSAASVAVAIDENEQYIIRNNVLLDNEGNSAEEGLLSTVAEVEAENDRLNLIPHPRPSEKEFSNQRYNEVAEERERARADAQRKKQEENEKNQRAEQERRDAFKRHNREFEENERKKKEEEERKKEKEKKSKKSKKTKSKKTKSKESKEKRGSKSKDKSNKKMIQ